MKKHYRQENDCLNCGTILQGKFCYNCGQENLQIKESFSHMLTHAVSDYFHFDQQFFHTLKPLLFKPGKLTNEYMAGRRVQYLHPVKMYIFISLVYFLLVFQVKKDSDIIKATNKPITKEQLTDSINKRVKAGNVKDLDALIRRQKTENHSGFKLNKSSEKDTTFSLNDIKYTSGTKGNTYQQYLAQQQKLPAEKRDNMFSRYFVKKAFDLNKPGLNKREIFADGINHNLPKMMFVLLPLFALILKITFWRNKKFYVEHLIFSFHLHCFLFLFLSIILLFEMVIPSSVGYYLDAIAFLIIAWYIYIALRIVYQRSAFRTITKMIGMTVVYSLFSLICLCLLIVILAITQV